MQSPFRRRLLSNGMDKATIKQCACQTNAKTEKGFYSYKITVIAKKTERTSEDGTVEKRVTNEKKKAKVPVKTDILINAELEPCVHEEQINEEVDDHQSISMESLLDLLKKTEEEKKNLLADKNKLEQENQQIRKKNEELTTEIEQLQLSVEQKSCTIAQMTLHKQKEAEKITVNVLSKVFTPGQIKKLMSPNDIRIKWSSEDITSAIALRSLSARTYRYLRDVKKIPLPCVATLQNWCAAFNVPPGILKDVLKIMKDKGHDLTITDKLTVLTFDEIYISNKLDLERREQKVYGPHKTCQFIMARGLFKKWKQPVFYDFDTSMTQNIMFSVIRDLYEAGYIVVAITCDMGPTNMKLWNELNIGIDISSHSENAKIKQSTGKQCFIVHPVDNSLKIFFYADVPHLLKLARNNLFDSGFRINGEFVDNSCLEELLALNTGDLKIAHKLSRAHLDVKGSQRQNVKMAAQVFSNQNASAIQWCGEKGLLACKQWKQMSVILKLFNDWFDVFNSQMKFGHHSGSHAYGINLEEQNKIINDMSQFIQEMRVGQRSALLQFQKGILICNKSLKEILPYIQDKYTFETFQIEYLLTRRLNQDILENFFSYLRSMGAGHDHPTPVELRNRLKWYILGKHSGHAISPGENTEGDSSSTPLIDIEDTRVDFINATCSQFLSDEEQITAEEELFMYVTEPDEISSDNAKEEEEKDDNNEEEEEEKGGDDSMLAEARMKLALSD